MYRQKFATKRVKYLDVVLIPRYNLYKSNIEGPGHMPRISPPSSLARRATPRGRPRSRALPPRAPQSYAGLPSLVVFVFAPGPVMFPMGAVALGSICWPSLLARSGFVELVPVVVHFPQLTWLLAFSGSP